MLLYIQKGGEQSGCNGNNKRHSKNSRIRFSRRVLHQQDFEECQKEKIGLGAQAPSLSIIPRVLMKNKNVTHGATIILCILGLVNMDYRNLSMLDALILVLIAVVVVSVCITIYTERRSDNAS